MHDAREIYMNAVVGLPSSERLRLAALILSELAQENESPAPIAPRTALNCWKNCPANACSRMRLKPTRISMRSEIHGTANLARVRPSTL
jgi:hypothetical protein